jgi:hypothetical protein
LSCRHLVEKVNKKSKNNNVKPFMVKNHLWVFINTQIENPAFDSQVGLHLLTRELGGVKEVRWKGKGSWRLALVRNDGSIACLGVWGLWSKATLLQHSSLSPAAAAAKAAAAAAAAVAAAATPAAAAVCAYRPRTP